jgi:uncharacterized protein (DUF2249 family)
MKLRPALYSFIVEDLKQLVRLCGGPGPDGVRKEQLVEYIAGRLTHPVALAEIWRRLDPLSQKAVATAYHAGGEFATEAFVAQYGELPGQMAGLSLPSMIYVFNRELSPVELFIHGGEIPEEIMDLLGPLVPPPEKFRVEGLERTPHAIDIDGERLTLLRADTEQTGLHDLLVYLRMLRQGEIRTSTTSRRLTPASVRKLLNNLLDGDFFSHAEGAKPSGAIRPAGLAAFARESGLAGAFDTLTEPGNALLKDHDLEAFLHAFETWTHEGSFDELGRISAVKGQKSKHARLTAPAERHEAIVEALSWCPAGVWISVEDFHRALKVWRFDFEIDLSGHLYVDDASYRWYDDATIRELYTNAVLWEYLGSIGALDLLYFPPEVAEYDSLYEGLIFFRINPLGAYLFGQAGEYEPPQPLDDPFFSIDSELVLTLEDPAALTPNLRQELGRFTVEQGDHRYRLDTGRVLDEIERGEDLRYVADFLERHHRGPLPEHVSHWLQELAANRGAFKRKSDALLVQVRSRELLKTVFEDPTLKRSARVLEGRTLIVPSSKERSFRNRLKELGYLLDR